MYQALYCIHQVVSVDFEFKQGYLSNVQVLNCKQHEKQQQYYTI